LLLGLAGLLLVRVSDAFVELAQQLQVEPHTALVAEPRVSSETVPTGSTEVAPHAETAPASPSFAPPRVRTVKPVSSRQSPRTPSQPGPQAKPRAGEANSNQAQPIRDDADLPDCQNISVYIVSYSRLHPERASVTANLGNKGKGRFIRVGNVLGQYRLVGVRESPYSPEPTVLFKNGSGEYCATSMGGPRNFPKPPPAPRNKKSKKSKKRSKR
jgi:hypothetical protein